MMATWQYLALVAIAVGVTLLLLAVCRRADSMTATAPNPAVRVDVAFTEADGTRIEWNVDCTNISPGLVRTIVQDLGDRVFKHLTGEEPLK